MKNKTEANFVTESPVELVYLLFFSLRRMRQQGSAEKFSTTLTLFSSSLARDPGSSPG